MKSYDSTPCAPSTEVHLHIPTDILKDLAIRAGENGRSIEFEISLRLARTLERELEMIAEDNDFAMLAYDESQRQEKRQGKKEG